MLKKAVIPVPKDLSEAARFLAEIGKEQRVIDKIQLDINARVEELKVKAINDAKPRQNRISQLMEGLFAYAEANRDELTENGKIKTIKAPTGVFCWRMTPPAVFLRNVKSIIANLKLLGLKQFIRIKEEDEIEISYSVPEDLREPRNLRSALKDPYSANWQDAVNTEINALVQSN